MMAHDDDDGGWCEVFLFHFHPKKRKERHLPLSLMLDVFIVSHPQGEQVARSAKMLSCFRKKLCSWSGCCEQEALLFVWEINDTSFLASFGAPGVVVVEVLLCRTRVMLNHRRTLLCDC